MTESQSHDMTVPGEGSGDNQSAEVTMSLMGGVARPEGLPEADLEFESLKTGSKLFNQGTLVMVLVFVVAAGSLYAMRFNQREPDADEATKTFEAKIEMALTKLTQGDDPLRTNNLNILFGDTEQIVAMFVNDPVEQPVPIEFIKKNPFLLGAAKSTGDPSGTSRSDAERRAAERLEKLQGEFARLELQTVMQGRIPVVIISNEMLRPGDVIGSFNVKRINIEALSVDLEGEGHIFTLTMENPADDSAGNTRIW